MFTRPNHNAPPYGVESGSGYQALLEYVNRLRFRTLTLGTLGPSGTSSEQAACYFTQQFLPSDVDYRVQLFDTFEDAATALRLSTIDVALVPHAYAHINRFYMCRETDLLFVYICPTPAYLLAKRPGAPLPQERWRIALHPATTPLADHLLRTRMNHEDYELAPTTATSIAAKMLQEGLVDLAITNETSARNYDFEIIEDCGPLRMSWSIFGRKAVKA